MHKDDYTSPPYERAEWRTAINILGGKNRLYPENWTVNMGSLMIVLDR